MRRVSAMVRVCEDFKWDGTPEDVYFAQRLLPHAFPPLSVARDFALEMGECALPSLNPSALHEPWRFQSAECVCSMLTDLPGRSTRFVQHVDS